MADLTVKERADLMVRKKKAENLPRKTLEHYLGQYLDIVIKLNGNKRKYSDAGAILAVTNLIIDGLEKKYGEISRDIQNEVCGAVEVRNYKLIEAIDDYLCEKKRGGYIE